MIRPSQPARPTRSAPPVVSAKTVPTSGTPAIRRPVRELDRCCSADPSMIHGIAISMAAKARSQRQRARIGRMSTRASAIGRRIAAAISVRARTRKDGETSATTTRMNRYGMPQMTDMTAKRSRPRRVIPEPYSGRRGLGERLDPSEQ